MVGGVGGIKGVGVQICTETKGRSAISDGDSSLIDIAKIDGLKYLDQLIELCKANKMDQQEASLRTIVDLVRKIKGDQSVSARSISIDNLKSIIKELGFKGKGIDAPLPVGRVVQLPTKTECTTSGDSGVQEDKPKNMFDNNSNIR